MNEKFLWMHAIDRKLFGDDCTSNKYIGTLVLMLVALLGAVCATSAIFGAVFHIGDLLGIAGFANFWTYAPFTSIPALALILESIICCKTRGKQVARSLLVVILTGIMYVAGCFAALAIYCLLILGIVYGIIRLAMGRSKNDEEPEVVDADAVEIEDKQNTNS